MNKEPVEPSCEKTSHYFWSTSDLIGVGSTADVYRAYRISDGEIVAVKSFHTAIDKYTHGGGEQLEASLKELVTLQQLNHRNVIKLLDVDSTNPTSDNAIRRVLVMEYCFSGSLQSQLENPENFYGLSEDDFLTLFNDLAEGIMYLRSKNIIHRDIKPSNIMLQFDSGGVQTYKLADFGAAKQLLFDAEEGFQSLVGTAEYLPPRMFEYWMSRDRVPMFRAESELWTIGVTLYQASTGQLPFRPYIGVRKDYQTMLRIVKNRPQGTLSGIQVTPKGPIEYKENLPSSCRLSIHLKEKLKLILRNLLDSQIHIDYTADQYYKDSKQIFDLVAISVLDSRTLECPRIYASPYQSLFGIGNQIHGCENSSSNSSSTLILYNGLLLHNIFDDSSKIEDLKNRFNVNWQNPLILCKVLSNDASVTFPNIPDICPIKRVNNVRDAYNWAREILGNMYLMINIVEQLVLHAKSLQNTPISLSLDVFTKMQKLKDQINDLDMSIKDNEVYIQKMKECEKSAILLGQSLPGTDRQNKETLFRIDTLKCKIRYAHELLTQFEEETKLQRFSNERTCAHMSRRNRLESIREDLKFMTVNNFYKHIKDQFGSWKNWILQTYQPLREKIEKLSKLLDASISKYPAKDIITSCHDCISLEECSKSSRSETDHSLEKLLLNIKELSQKHQSISDSIGNNETMIKRITMLLIGGNSKIDNQKIS
ncbi:hypothetical protein GJ496_005292 [Pomphorhynchus laevis]|nr:hypothetical protein GJ496_005292 [Pomphorhynchus laevis]